MSHQIEVDTARGVLNVRHSGTLSLSEAAAVENEVSTKLGGEKRGRVRLDLRESHLTGLHTLTANDLVL